MPADKRVLLFSEGGMELKDLLGNKGANLCEMTKLGLPVPPGFVVTTDTCKAFFEAGKTLPPGLKEEYMEALKKVEKQCGRVFGDTNGTPLLLSVRSGAVVSMPGMMDTVLNLGLNDEVVAAMVKATGNKKWAFDCYRRLIQMYNNVVLGSSNEPFEAVIKDMKTRRGYTYDMELTGDDWEEVVGVFKRLSGNMPQAPLEQLEEAIKAVFSSWFTPRAVRYREYNKISNDLGTAVNIQMMVYGNMNENSGTGVAFTRNPATGEAVFYGEYLDQAEGEDVVSGVRTPHSLAYLREKFPNVYAELDRYQQQLEQHHRDMQDIEFTVESGKLYMLQTRNGKRTAKASVQIAVDMVKEGLITEKEALLRIDAERMNYFLHPTCDPKAHKVVLGKGLPASPGATTGEVVFTPEEAEAMVKADPKRLIILVRKETTADDIHGMRSAAGILTENGGMTSHAAVVARGMGKCCVSGCHSLHVDYEKRQFTTADGKRVVKQGDVITLDGSTGEVLLGDVARIPPGADANFQTILSWSIKHAKLGVAANADTPKDARVALQYGAVGIGLCRTEHMFFDPARIDHMRAMILAKTAEERINALDVLFEFQKTDMRAMFEAMSGKHVTIRLLDPPLHEFLPQNNEDVEALAKRLGKPVEAVLHAIEELKEANPMLGFRGCRLSVKYPEITAMQVRAIVTAALEAQKKGAAVQPEIMIPLTSTARELELIIPQVREEVQKTFAFHKATCPVRVGTMIEIPRACLTAESISPLVDFMSFGTNDLTQMCFGFSRDDISHFLPIYLEKKILKADPFVEIDQEGVGQLITMTIERSKAANKGVQYGVCGEQGGEPNSVAFFHKSGLHYVSCSPFRVPIAWIAAAQAAIKSEGGGSNGKKQQH